MNDYRLRRPIDFTAENQVMSGFLERIAKSHGVAADVFVDNPGMAREVYVSDGFPVGRESCWIGSVADIAKRFNLTIG